MEDKPAEPTSGPPEQPDEGSVEATDVTSEPSEQPDDESIETTNVTITLQPDEESIEATNPPIRLHPNERVLIDILPSKWWTLGRYVFTLGLWTIWRKRHHYILTNQRIVLTKGIINKTERSAPLSRIQDAQLHRSPLTGGRVALSTAGGALGVEGIAYLTRADALALADALTPLLGGQQQGL